MLYDCETWTLDSECVKRIEALEMWLYRRMLKVPWTEKLSNEAVLKRMKRDRTMVSTIRKRQLKFFGHVWRDGGLENLVISGRIDGKRDRGRQRITHTTSLRQYYNLIKYVIKYRNVEVRGRQRKMETTAQQQLPGDNCPCDNCAASAAIVN